MKDFCRSSTFRAILLVALLVSACSWSPAGETVEASQSGLRASLEVPPQMSTGETTQLTFTLVNEGDIRLYLLRWYTPPGRDRR